MLKAGMSTGTVAGSTALAAGAAAARASALVELVSRSRRDHEGVLLSTRRAPDRWDLSVHATEPLVGAAGS